MNASTNGETHTMMTPDERGMAADDLTGFNAHFSADVPANAKGSTQATTYDGNTALFTDAHTTDLGPDPGAYTIMFWVKGRDIDQENSNTRLMTTRVLPNGSGTGVSTWQVEGFGNNGTNGDKMDLRMNGPSFGTNNWFQPDAINALARLCQAGPTVERAFVALVLIPPKVSITL